MRIAIVTSRLRDTDDQLALHRFVCCDPGAPEYAMDEHRYIRGLRLKDEPGMYRMVLQYGEAKGEPILGFCEFGYVPASPESSGYAISFIATALAEHGRHLGTILLDSVLRWMANDAAIHGREPYVLTQINPHNAVSVRLFANAGFEDEGADEDDPEYHIWSRTFKSFATDRLYLYPPSWSTISPSPRRSQAIDHALCVLVQPGTMTTTPTCAPSISTAALTMASKTELVIEARNTCDAFGAQLRRVAKDMAVLNGASPDDEALRHLKINWRNPERPSQAAMADAVLKQVQAIPWLANSRVILEQLGYTDTDITRLLSDKNRQNAAAVLDRLVNMNAAGQPANQPVNGGGDDGQQPDTGPQGRGQTGQGATGGGEGGQA